MKRLVPVFTVLAALMSLFSAAFLEVGSVEAQVPTVSSMAPTSGPAGTGVTLWASGFAASQSYQVTISATVVSSGTTPSVALASFNTAFTVPGTLTPGTYVVQLTTIGPGSPQFASAPTSFQITAPTGPAIYVSPAYGLGGTIVTLTGSGFTAAQNFGVTVGGLSVVPSATTTGTGSFSVTFTVPTTLAYGPCVVVLTTTGPGTLQTASAAFQVGTATGASISVLPTQGPVGTTVTLNASGFLIGQNYTVTMGGLTVLTSSTSASSFTVSFIVPSITPGTYNVELNTTTPGPVQTATATFQVIKGAISLSSTQGTVGQIINVSGNGFGTSLTITFYFDNGTLPSFVVSSSTGAFATGIAIPETPAGTHQIKAADSAGNTSDPVTFTVVPKVVSVSPNSGNSLTMLSISANGFAASDSSIAVYLGNNKLPSVVASDQNGTVASQQVKVGEIPGGIYQVKLVDVSGDTATAATSFTVTQTFLVDAANLYVGKRVTMAGMGFAANASLSVLYDGSPVTPESPIRTQATGSFGGAFSAPKSIHGPHTLIVTDGTYSQSVTLVMESTPPLAPTLQTPPLGTRIGGPFGKQTPSFTWTSVTDPSGVSYSFQLGRDQAFTVPMLSKDSVTVTTYALSPVEALDRGTYYWRVRAVDGAGNASDWTNPFRISTNWPIPGWTFVLFIVLAVAAIGLGIMLFARGGAARI